MKIETVNENGQSDFAPILPPTVAAVKQLAHSKLLLSSGIVIFMTFLIWSVCDFAAGVILLPLGALMLVAHTVTFVKSKNGKGDYGLAFLSAAYLLPLAVQCVFELWELVFDNRFISPFFEKLKGISLNLPKPLSNTVNGGRLNSELIFSAVVILLLAVSSTLSLSVTAKQKNTPSSAAPVAAAFVSAAEAGFFGFYGGQMLYNVLTDVFYTTTAADFKLASIVSSAILFLFAAYAVLMLIYFIKITVKMKRIKNVVQK